jgi:hypothetical protein
MRGEGGGGGVQPIDETHTTLRMTTVRPQNDGRCRARPKEVPPGGKRRVPVGQALRHVGRLSVEPRKYGVGARAARSTGTRGRMTLDRLRGRTPTCRAAADRRYASHTASRRRNQWRSTKAYRERAAGGSSGDPATRAKFDGSPCRLRKSSASRRRPSRVAKTARCCAPPPGYAQPRAPTSSATTAASMAWLTGRPALCGASPPPTLPLARTERRNERFPPPLWTHRVMAGCRRRTACGGLH